MSKDNQAWVLFLGRVAMAALFIVAGVSKSMRFAGTVAYMTKNGVPMAEVLLPIWLIMEIGGGLLILIGWKVKWVGLVYAISMVVITPIFHAFWTFDAAQYGNQMNHFLKNLALFGGFLYLWAFGAGAYSLDERRRS